MCIIRKKFRSSQSKIGSAIGEYCRIGNYRIETKKIPILVQYSHFNVYLRCSQLWRSQYFSSSEEVGGNSHFWRIFLDDSLPFFKCHSSFYRQRCFCYIIKLCKKVNAFPEKMCNFVIISFFLQFWLIFDNYLFLVAFTHSWW